MSEKKKILFIGCPSVGGGKERRMCELIRYLNSTGDFDIHLLTVDEGQPDYPNYNLGLDEDRILKLDRTGSRIATYRQLGRILKELKPDVVHDWIGARTGLYINPRLPFRKFRYVAGFIADGNPLPLADLAINKITYLFSDKVVSNSLAGIKAQKAPMRKSMVIYNGFNSDRLSHEDKAEELRKEFNLGNKHVVSMAARMTPAKDYRMLLDVAAIVRQSRSDVVFLAVGTGPQRKDLEKLARQRGIDNVIFTGQRADVEQIFRLSDVSVLCTNNRVHAEGVSNSIMESMACETPVIATDGGGTPEIIQDGVNGYIVSPGDAQAMAAKLLQLIDNTKLREEMGKAGKDLIEKKFSIEKMTADYLKIY